MTHLPASGIPFTPDRALTPQVIESGNQAITYHDLYFFSQSFFVAFTHVSMTPPIHFLNESKNIWRPIGSIGYSCAVDSLLDIYYYCLFLTNSVVREWNTGIFQQLNDVCRQRFGKGQDVLYVLRDVVWDWLVTHPDPVLQRAFAPKGTIRAEFIQAIFELTSVPEKEDACLFRIRVPLNGTCSVCGQDIGREKQLGPLLTLSDGGRMLSSVIQSNIISYLSKSTRELACSDCEVRSAVHSWGISLPEFLFFEVPIVDGLNTVRISEYTELVNVRDYTYELSGIVFTRPGHFYCATKFQGSYWLMDSLSNHPQGIAVPFSLTQVQAQAAVHMIILRKNVRETGIDTVDGDIIIGHSNHNPREQPVTPNVFVEAASKKSRGPTSSSAAGFSRNDDDCVQDLTQNNMSTPMTSQKIKSCPTPSSSDHTPGDNRGTIKVGEAKVRYLVRNSALYLHTTDVYSEIGIENQISKMGYKEIDGTLTTFQTNNVKFIRKGRYREYILSEALLHIIATLRKKKDIKDKMNEFRDHLLESLNKETAVNLKVRRQFLSTPEQKELDSCVSPSRTPMVKKSSTSRKPKAKRKIFEIDPGSQQRRLQAALREIRGEIFGNDHTQMVETLARCVGPQEDKFFSCDDVDQILETAQIPIVGSIGKSFESLRTRYERRLKDQMFLHPDETVHIERNLKGTRLTQYLRGRFSGFIPTVKKESDFKKLVQKEYNSILLPQATHSGISVDPQRLVELLRFRYPLVQNKINWKLYGDGFEMGGRKTAFLGISILNDEASNYGVKFQDPSIIFPTNLFYGSDSRDNLEANLADQRLRRMVEESAREQPSRDDFFLAADEMFLIAERDGSGTLGPTTNTGWDIYHECDKDSKGHCDPTTGLRTDVNIQIDREHPQSLLPIPINKVMMCILHGQVRVTEKLADLVLEYLMSERNKMTERGVDGVAWYEEKISVLQENLSKRGVKQNNFIVHFNTKGEPEPVKLNHSDSIAILTPATGELAHQYPEPFQNVISSSRTVTIKNTKAVQTLGLKDTYTEYELLREILHNFYKMNEILSDKSSNEKDSGEDRCFESTKNQEDDSKIEDVQSSRHTEEEIACYTKAAETFYQLFVAMFSAARLTPYMMKYVDHVPEIMTNTQYRLGRFMNQGGEHRNYKFHTYYLTHTCRSGGSMYINPFRSLLEDAYFSLRFEIMHHEGHDKNNTTVNSNVGRFQEYLSRHLAACTIQSRARQFITRRQLERLGFTTWKEYSVLPEDRKHQLKDAILGFYHSKVSLRPPTNSGIFHRMNFVTIGNVPKKLYKTRDQLMSAIKENGGRIYPHQALNTKGKERIFFFLAHQNILDKTDYKIPRALREGLKRGSIILGYDFIEDCVSSGQRLDIKSYKLDLKSVSKYVIARYATSRRKNLNRQPKFITRLRAAARKKAKKTSARKNPRILKPGRNVRLDYALQERSNILNEDRQKGKKHSIRYAISLLAVCLKNWDQLSDHQRQLYTEHWELRRTTHQSRKKTKKH